MEKVRVEGGGAVRQVTLTRADKRNALDAEMLAALTEAFTAAPPDDERVVVIRAEGPVFCSGLDLRERGGGAVGGAGAIEAMLHAIETYPLPVVAVVQGDAIAGGNELALHCDFVVASETARFGMSLAKIGLAPTWFLAKKSAGGGRPGRRPRDAAAGRSVAGAPHGRAGPDLPLRSAGRAGDRRRRR